MALLNSNISTTLVGNTIGSGSNNVTKNNVNMWLNKEGINVDEVFEYLEGVIGFNEVE